jgi:26S proteasome regulatory subunit N3
MCLILASFPHSHLCPFPPQVSDIYSTGEPQSAFHARIAFCLDLHNEAVKAMRYEVR